MQININELIKEVNKDYMPLKIKKEKEKKEQQDLIRRGALINVKLDEDDKKLFELTTRLELYKILKSLFMEELTKNQKLIDYLVEKKILTLHTEIVKDKDNKEVEVQVIDQDMDYRISVIPEEFSQPIIEKLVKSHKENIGLYEKGGKTALLDKERLELDILSEWLPKEASREDIMKWLTENYPTGITQREIGPTIGKTVKAFERVDGKLVSECVRSIVHE
jgi:hypothetical protein